MLRSLSLGRPDAVSSYSASPGVRQIALWMLTASAVALGGCSADFLRFDAPAFNLGNDSGRDVRPVAGRADNYAPTGSTLAEARRDDYDRSPTAMTMRPERRVLGQVARAKPMRQAAPAPRTVRAQPQPQQFADASPLATGALGGAGSGRITVERGDTLYQLSRRHGVSVAALRDANNLTGNIIRPGQTLVLPSRGGYRAPRTAYKSPALALTAPLTRTPVAGGGGRVVTVVPGDSLYAISRRTGVSVSRIKQLNGITDVRRLRPGMQLSLGDTVSRTARRNTMPKSVVAEAQKPVSRTDFGQTSKIKAKPIRTVSIGRDMAPAPSTAPTSAAQPRILNGDGVARAPAAPAKRMRTAALNNAPVKFRWPAKGRIIATFNNSGKGVKNDGINISLPVGTPIQAVDDGTVAYSGSELKGYGNLVLLRHENGWVSAYAHASELLVKRGDKVTKGQVVAKAGRSGGVTQPQLHFELRKEAQPVDPLPHMAQM